MDKIAQVLILNKSNVHVSHHWAVDGTDAVVAHVQRGQVTPQRNNSCDWTARLCTLRFPLWEFAWFWNQDRLKNKVSITTYISTEQTMYSLNVNMWYVIIKFTIIVSVVRWILIVARLDLRDDKPCICWELHSLIWRNTKTDVMFLSKFL